jgi:hypothetical protein
MLERPRPWSSGSTPPGAILVAKLTLGEFAQGDVWFGGTDQESVED